jgi:aldehyde dehydrogenase (NAD+)
MVPAPKRGEYVRRIGEKMRERKDELGRLVPFSTYLFRHVGRSRLWKMQSVFHFASGKYCNS